MKLYVCHGGLVSENPETWSIWDEYTLVLANNEEEAKSISGEMYATEVNQDKPCVLAHITEPNWGEDL